MTKDLRDEKQSGEVKKKISNLAHGYIKSSKPTFHALTNIEFVKIGQQQRFFFFMSR